MTKRQHIQLIIIRLLIAAGIVLTLALSMLMLGEDPDEAGVERPTAFAFLVMATFIGSMLAAAYVVVGSIAHALLRRHYKAVLGTDIVLGVVLLLLMLFGGTSSKYESKATLTITPASPAASEATRASGSSAN